MLVNCGNYFHEKAFKEVCSNLDNGQTVEVYIDCIGHNRNNREQDIYKEALQEKYGRNLMIEWKVGAYSYSYSYRLQYFAGGANA